MPDVITREQYDLPKTLALDWKTWRCGRNSAYRRGEGPTELLNMAGFMCCLGQFCEQAGIPHEKLQSRGTPRGLFLEGDYVRDFCQPTGLNNELTSVAIMINDNEDTTPHYKLKQLKSLFAEHGYTIKVINKD